MGTSVPPPQSLPYFQPPTQRMTQVSPSPTCGGGGPQNPHTHSRVGAVGRQTSPAWQGQIWLMLKARPPGGTWQVCASASRRWHTRSPCRRAQHPPAPHSSSRWHRAPAMGWQFGLGGPPSPGALPVPRWLRSIWLMLALRPIGIMSPCVPNLPAPCSPSCPSGTGCWHFPNMQRRPWAQWVSRRQYCPAGRVGRHSPKCSSQKCPWAQGVDGLHGVTCVGEGGDTARQGMGSHP